MNTEEEEWLTSQLNPSTIVASETRDKMTEASDGGKTYSTSKNAETLKKKEYFLGLVLTGKCIFLHDDIQNIMRKKKSILSKSSTNFKDQSKLTTLL